MWNGVNMRCGGVRWNGVNDMRGGGVRWNIWCGVECDEMWWCGTLPPCGCVMWNVAVWCGL